eukprot:TRINITY_DN9105_c0_g1_i1.p1 TRINITY_DN9105_c0_g1~~TRINITY_DN9105_c0_g1_i1.p1  ORF type:complete len:174 (-),score=19.78 TRINITY_DN9105_c0_g1_i1:146-667(-)
MLRASKPTGAGALSPLSFPLRPVQFRALHHTAAQKAHAKNESKVQEASQDASSKMDRPDVPSMQSTMKLFGLMAAVLSVVGAFYAVAFLATGYLATQVKDVMAPYLKKDFVPYSERQAVEAKLLEDRAAQDASEMTSAPDVKADGSSEDPSEDAMRSALQRRDLLDLLPGQKK